MVNSADYQKSIASFATSIEAALQRTQSSQYVIVRTHVQLLRSIVAFGAYQLDSFSGDLNKMLLFNVEYELQRINDLTWNIGIEIDAEPENPLILALKTVKSMVILSKLRVDIGQAANRLLYVLNECGLIMPRVTLQGTQDLRTTVIDEISLEQFLSGLQVAAGNFPALKNNKELNFAFRVADVTEQDSNRISPVFTAVKTIVDASQGQLKSPQKVAKMMNDFAKICKSKKVDKLLTSGGLKASADFLQLIDEELLRLLYQQNVAPEQFKINYATPTPQEILGEGTFGKVIAGVFYNSATAVKSLSIKGTLNPSVSTQGRQELISELRSTWKRFNSPNLVKLYGCLVFQDVVLLMSEKLEMSLDDLIHTKAKYKMSPEEITYTCVGIVRGLKFLHQNNIIHGDIHPGSVILNNVFKNGKVDASNMEVKLGDFGTRTLKNDLKMTGLLRNDKILAQRIESLKAYQAPEILTNAQWTFAADIYSFGLVAWEMGQNNMRAFQGVVDLHQIVVMANSRPPLDSPNLTAWMREMISYCWQAEPWLRPLSVEILRTLEHNVAAQEAIAVQGQATIPRNNVDEQKSNAAALRASAKHVVESLAIPEPSKPRVQSSRLSGVRRSVRNSVRNSVNMRASVILQKQKFLFLDEVETNSHIALGIKVVKTMRNYLGDSEVQLRGINAIRLLALREGNELKLMKMGAGRAILEAMKAHPEEPAIQEPGCGGICNLCYNPENSKALMRSGASHLVLKALTQHKDDVFVIEEGLQALTNLHRGDSQRQSVLIYLGASKVIMDCLKAHPNHPRVQEEAFAAIAYLQPGFRLFNRENPNATKKRKAKKSQIKDFYEMNAHREIIETMKTLGAQPGVQIEGCSALKAICMADNNRKKDIIKYGGLEAIQKAMKTFRDNAAVQEAACSLVSALAILKESNAEMVKLEFDVFILNAMMRHRTPSDEALQVRAVFAIHNWCFGNKKISNRFKKNGAIKIIAQALKLYPDNSTLKTKGQDAAKLVSKGGKL